MVKDSALLNSIGAEEEHNPNNCIYSTKLEY